MNAARSHETIRSLEPLTLRPLRREPLVSVLLTNYNYEPFIADSIESVLNQTYRTWELVICDDGSTDGSVPLIKRYLAQDRRITLYEKPNGGHTSSLNLAFSKCSGDIVCLLDADDLFTHDKLQQLVKMYLDDLRVGLAVHRVIRVDQDRHRQGVYPLSAFAEGWLGRELLDAGGIIPCAPPTSAISLRREVADVIFPISATAPLHMCPDQVIMRIAPLVTAIKRAPLALAEHRVHRGNAYSQDGVSLPAVTRQLQISRALWQEQHRFLSETSPEIAARLGEHDDNSSAAVLRYIEAKLRGSPNVSAALSHYLAVCKGKGETKWLFFWRISICLPNFIFQPAVSTLLGQGALKQFVSRLRKLA